MKSAREGVDIHLFPTPFESIAYYEFESRPTYQGLLSLALRGFFISGTLSLPELGSIISWSCHHLKIWYVLSPQH